MDNHVSKNSDQASDMPPLEKKKRPVFLIIFLILLSGIIAYLGYTYFDLKKQSELERTELERQKSNLEIELRDIYNQYDSLKTENDTINQKLAEEQQKIESLLKKNANNIYKIHLYEKELKTIRQILRSYVVQIDSLNTANEQLRTENINVRRKLQQEQSEKSELREELTQKTEAVEVASVLIVKNIVITPINSRSREMTRSSKTEKLRICFTIMENRVVKAGSRVVYMRITRPDEVILTSGVNFFEFEGEQIVYTASREVDYNNADIEMCIFWDNDGQLVPGTYKLSLYSEGNIIGSSSFSLK